MPRKNINRKGRARQSAKGPKVQQGDPGTGAPPKGLSREGHIAFRKPITDARHRRIVMQSAEEQPDVKKLTDVVMPEEWGQVAGWQESVGVPKEEWVRQRPIRKQILDEAIKNAQNPQKPENP